MYHKVHTHVCRLDEFVLDTTYLVSSIRFLLGDPFEYISFAMCWHVLFIIQLYYYLCESLDRKDSTNVVYVALRIYKYPHICKKQNI